MQGTPQRGVSPGGSTDFSVSPVSVAPGKSTFQPNTAVFYEDPGAGWSVGVVLGQTHTGQLAVRDPQRNVEVLLKPGDLVLAVPPVFSKLTSATFASLPTLSHLPRMPRDVWEPAVFFTFLHRLAKDLVELPVTKSGLLTTAFPGHRGEVVLADVAKAVRKSDFDSCVIMLPGGTGRSIPRLAKATLAVPRRCIALMDDVSSISPRAEATFALLDVFTTYSSSGQPAVPGIAFTLDMVFSPGKALTAVKVTPLVFNHALVATGTVPYPTPDPAVELVSSTYLAFYLLAESPLVSEYGLPPMATLAGILPARHFDQGITFDDACAALDFLGVGGHMGVQAWAVVGAVLHLLIARWVAIRSELGVTDAVPYGVLSVASHISWAAKCLAIPRNDLYRLVQQQGSNMEYNVTPTSLAGFAAHLYDRLVHTVLREAAGYQGAVPILGSEYSDSMGKVVHIISLLPASPPHRGQIGVQGAKLKDREYLVSALANFLARHAPDKAERAASLLFPHMNSSDGSLDASGVATLLANLEVKYNCPGWFANREKLHDVYAQCRPELLDSIDEVLQQYKGREYELFEALKVKFKPRTLTGPPLAEQLESFFTRFDRSRLSEVDQLCAEWEGREHLLEEKLEDDYSTHWLTTRRECWLIYAEHNPKHLGHLDILLDSPQYKGMEDELLLSLRQKYGRRRSGEETT
eukprot:Sspe_Gene.18815::Locus_6800_Transcript_1_1_Confidence_1.000_Length_2125::g.18815::m.18815